MTRVSRIRLLIQDRADEQGFSLVDAMISVFILGVVVVAFVSALSTGATATGEADQQGIAQGIAMSQLEYVKSLAYVAGSGSYASISVPSGWGVTAVRSAISEASGNTDVQKITVTVTRGGATILTVEDFKVNR
jgi:Tfp pilus assembly protein PilV